MRFRGFLATLALVVPSLVPTSGFSKPKEIRLKASSNWLVNWADHSCVLARKFGPATSPVLLNMRAYEPGYSLEMIIAGKEISAFQKSKTFTISYGSGEPIPVSRHQAGTSGDFGPSVVFGGVMKSRIADERAEADDSLRPFPDIPFEKQLNHISLANSFKTVVLETGPMAKAFDTLRQCTDNLVKQWGLDPAIQAALTRKVKARNIPEWARQIQASFPSELLMQNKQARVNVLVVVDELGMPADCDAWQAFDNTDFKVRACGIILRNARFNPALDKDGRPTRSYYATVIVYTS